MKSASLFAHFVGMTCLAIACNTWLPAQTGGEQPQASSTVAYVYVSSNPSGTTYEINAFAADSKGQLTTVPGSPFSANVFNMALNGKYLFGTDGTNIYTFSIGSSGSLTEVSSVNAEQFNPGGGGGPYALFLDHTGATLYDEDVNGYEGNNDYQFFNIDKSTGQLNYFGVTSTATEEFWTPLSFTGNDEYAFGSDCYHFGADLYGFKRNSDGSLTYLNNNPPMPTAKAGDYYCPYLAEADPTNNLAVSVQQLCCGYGGSPVGAPQIATYTVDSSGNATTSGTYSNMPKTAVKNVTDMSMSPSGQLLAVAGTAGLQVFHFNGASPATRYTGLLMKDPVQNIDRMFWDNANHLYVVSSSASKLYVFTITPTTHRQAPGSPYAITNPQFVIVLPKT